MRRREFLRLSAGTAASLWVAPARAQSGNSRDFVRAFRAAVRSSTHGTLELRIRWDGDFATSTLRNAGKQPVRIPEVVLADFVHGLPPDTALYGESLQMLSQTAGTLAQPVELGYSELKHYRLPQPEGATALSGAVMLTRPGDVTTLAAFTSCHRFNGRFYLQGGKLRVVIDTENLELAPGETWNLEEFFLGSSRTSADLTSRLAHQIARNHPHQIPRTPPTGWCSWYCFGPRVTAEQVLANLDVIANQIPALKYVQVDDGYQPAMGDWLETGTAFGGDVQSVLKKIRERGFEPAIWVAPFIAEKNSHVFQQHPEWFMKDDAGAPLPSDRVTFGGWRHGPWYALDGTHPEVQQHFEQLFRTMRNDWGCTYFKLDANFWGAMHGARLRDPRATRIEAYRRGMQAIRRGAGDAFILGCNHPIWASFGLIDGSRSSGDIKRSWATFAKEARQTLLRNWQNGTLWWNDPDAVLLTAPPPGEPGKSAATPPLTDDEFQFHATAIYASGGMVLSGDDLTNIPPPRLAMLRKLLPPNRQAARFEDASLRLGRIDNAKDASMICCFNWEDTPQALRVRLPRKSRVTDYWSGADLGDHSGEFILTAMPPHSARLLRLD